MKSSGKVKSVLTGKAVSFAHGSKSAIDKKAVGGRQSVSFLGLNGDEQGDLRFHGGVEKALHIYPTEHYNQWVEELGERDIFRHIGAFGENISSVGVTEEDICLGDKVRIGSTLLEVSQGRMPCWKLNVRFDQKDMAKRLQDSLRTGWYFRVLQEGDIGQGDDIILCDRPYPEWSLARIMSVIFEGCLETSELQKLAQLPLVESWKKLVDRRISDGVVEDWSPRIEGPCGKDK
ncbi:MOSC domain-containing protein [Vibrio pectenicida]|uniref:MOSC domain-containing protein n=1 Tax=Vibrio pectenicida TaxID=62763 RepID=A0A7Y4EEV1_9VIBR|nr:MOSC domain-containing protein [Vibrio pectenicida]NOH71748.1 MOSC domain-containing protein [Vibrio pectenicida]